MDKRTADKDWLEIFRQGKQLREQFNKADTYASAELTDIQMRQFNALSDDDLANA